VTVIQPDAEPANNACRLLPANQAPLEQIVALFAAIAADAGAAHFHPHPFTEAQAQHIHDYTGRDAYFLVIRQGAVAGYAMLRGWDEGFAIPSLGLYLLPGARGQGMGRQVMAHLHAAARARDATNIRLKVYADNVPAQRLYTGMGYVFSGEDQGQIVGFLDLNETTEELPGITVVVPSYNQGQYIDETLRSLLEQNYPHLEVIVLDACSTDGTVERLRCYGDRIVWASERDKGQTDALIKGFARASHPWMTWLNSDDFQTENALWVIGRAIVRDPKADVIMGNGHYANPDSSFLRPYPRIECTDTTDMVRQFFNYGYVAQPSVYFSKQAYQRVGGLNPTKNLCMDYDLWVRFAVHGCRFIAIDADISASRWYEDTKTMSQLEALYKEIIDTQQKFFGKVSTYIVQAVSDYHYSMFFPPKKKLAQSKMPPKIHKGCQQLQLLWRWLFFKAFSLKLNWRNPSYCFDILRGPFFKRGGALANDPVTLKDILFFSTK